jgi:transposase
VDVCLPCRGQEGQLPRVGMRVSRPRVAPQYPSDVTDAEWEVLCPEAEAVMAELRHNPAGRPMEHDLRAVLEAIGYVTRYGIEWRALHVDFPSWEVVYAFFVRCNERGLPQGLVDRLRGRLRTSWGRSELPTAGSIDSQSVKASDTVGADSRGYDVGNHAGRVVMPGLLSGLFVVAGLGGWRW